MAETVTLRAYLNELESLLERDSLTEAISHCHYILQHYPQNVETYRILAKALLQRGHNEGVNDLFKEAAEVFQRVLSVLPNDYVAHLGMNEIREHEGALDEALWHLERAYEQIPGNQMLQQALRDLYIKRDGAGRATEKIQLTRAALARQYINGQLYDQALIELRTALQQNPDRVDLQVLLAETLWESQHPIEAAETAVQILKKLPNCLPANRILARLWLDNERPTDAQVYLDRLEAVDPYVAASVVRPDSEAPDSIVLTRLDYQAHAQMTIASETPAWMQELGELGDNFDMSSDVFQAPASKQTPATPPARLEAKPAFGNQDVDLGSWSAPASPSAVDDVPDWFADLEGGFTAPETPVSPSPDPASMGWFNEQPAFGTDKPAVEPPALAADVPDWFADVLQEKPSTEPEKPSAVDAEWLMGEGEEMLLPSLDALLETPPASASAVDAEWLMDEGEGAAEVSLPASEPMFELPLESELATEPAAAPSAEAEWLWEDEEKTAEPGWPAPDLLADSETIPFRDALEDKPSSGFTGLLEEIEAARTSPNMIADMAGEPTPPAWLSDFGEDDLTFTPPAAQPVSPAAEPSFSADDLFGTSPEGLSLDSLESLGQDEFAWTSLESEPLPETGQEPQKFAPSAEKDAPGDDVAFLASFDEPLPDLKDTFDAAETAGPLSTLAEEWLPDLKDMAEVWGDVPEISEMPEAASNILDEPIEPAFALPDWAREAALAEEVKTSDWVDAEQPAIPAPPVMDEDLMALFETHEKVISPDETWSPVGDREELQVSEPEKEPEMDWLQPAATEDDWLGSFARPAAETQTAETGAALPLDALVQPAETSESMLWPESTQASQPAAETGPDDEWLASMNDLQLESVPEISFEEPFSLEAAEAPAFDQELKLDAVEPEPPVPSETTTSGKGLTSRLLSSLADMQDEAAESDTPAWLASMEPVKSPAGQDADSLFDQPYDPFAAGNPDNVPQYISAKDTGILQPDEKPDWMTAFTGEEMPAEPQEALESEFDLSEFIEPTVELHEPAPAMPDTIMNDLRQEVQTSDDYFLNTEELSEPDLGEPELAQSGESEGSMPDWLVAITKPETDKFRDLLPAEPESYSPGDSGVLQPGSEPDWLQQIDGSPEPGHAPAEMGATEGLPLDLFDDAFALSEDAGASQSGSLDLNQGDAQPLDLDIADMVLGSEDFATESASSFGDDFDAQDMLADLALFRETEVAQPDDLAHTKQTEQMFDEVAFSDDDLDDEPVPDDFSFGDLLPMVLRQVSGHDLGAGYSPRPEESLPDWLTDAFKDEG